MAPQAPASDLEVFFNKTNIALARSQRLVQSWLPPRQEDEEDATREDSSKPQLLDEFQYTPELLGVGATLPKDYIEGKPGTSTFPEKLRRQLLGKQASKPGLRTGAAEAQVKKPYDASKRPSKPQHTAIEDSSDEEEGRASSFRSKRKVPRRSEGTQQANLSHTDPMLPQPDQTHAYLPVNGIKSPVNGTGATLRGLNHGRESSLPAVNVLSPKPAHNSQGDDSSKRRRNKKKKKRKQEKMKLHNDTQLRPA